MTKEQELFELFDVALNSHPFLWFEIGYTRPTDWMVHIWNKAGGVEVKILTVQEYDRESACRYAVEQLQEFLGIESV